MMPDMGFFDRHRSKIEYGAPSGCWLWNAATVNGYGSVASRGKSRKAHREAYEDHNGFGSAEGLIVRHKCDTPACVNPSHLVLGTVADNNSDMVERQRQARGETNGNAKLTEADVRAIRATYVRGSSTQGLDSLARRFGVDPSLIGLIVNRKRWGHVK